jgi:glycosyltransferase involved in cell wall biosynthesis
MRIAFYAPLKAPDDPVPSGDRTMARSLRVALGRAGWEVELACRLRTFDGSGDRLRQRRIALLSRRAANLLVRRYRKRPASARPQAWFTYHVYYKAPDWLGPRVCRALGIPYVIAEASHSPRRLTGPWARGARAAAGAIGRARLIVGLNSNDAPCVLPLLHGPARWLPMPPFLTLKTREREALPEALRQRLAGEGPPEGAVLLTVAMMRQGDKLASYRLLAEALGTIRDVPWRLWVAGDGPARAQVHAAFAGLASRVTWLGVQPQDVPGALPHNVPGALPHDVPGVQPHDVLGALYRSADLYVWPAVNEAYGMTFLEAEAAGLPVVAGRSGGVADVVADGRSGILVPAGDARAFAQAVRSLIDDPERRRHLGAEAARTVRAHHDIRSAAATLGCALERLVPRQGPRP